MRIEKIKRVYKYFDELTKERQQEEIQNAIDNHIMDFEIEYFLEEYIRQSLEEEGIEANSIYYSLSYSQGDGISFECKNFDVTKLANELEIFKNVDIEELTIVIKKTSHFYEHEYTIDAYIENYYTNDEKDYSKLEDALIELIREKLQQTRDEAYRWMEDLYKEENIIDYYISNEIEFLELEEED